MLWLAVPPAVLWVKWQEQKILQTGTALTSQGLEDARRMGVFEPEKIRVLVVDQIPLFNGGFMDFLSRVFPQVTSKTVGLSLRHGIYVRRPFAGDRHLVAHECVHTGQYERAGSIARFLVDYFAGCIEFGYPDAPLEREAIERSADLGDIR